MVKKRPIERTPMRPTALMLGVALAAPLAAAQSTEKSVEPKQSIHVVPRVTVIETWTDNVRLSSDGQSERITEVKPGIRVDVNKVRLKGFLDYSLSGLAYANATAANRSVNTLSSNLQLEAVDDTLFVEATGTIAQQATSAFGNQSIDNTSINANRAEVSTYRISPYVKGHLGGDATYTARYSRSTTSSGAVGGANSANNEMSLLVQGDVGTSRLSWAVDAKSQDVSFSAGRATENSRALFVLAYAVTPRLKVLVEAGTESNNYTTLSKESNPVNGVAMEWRPMEATKLSAILLRHSFGDTYSLNFDHRTGRTVWHFTDSQDVTPSPGLQGASSTGSAYDLYYAQFAATEPDPIARAQLVNAYLQTYGISPGAAVNTGFATSSLAIQRRQQLSFAILGKRDTLTFIASQAESNRLDTLTNAVDDFTTSPKVRQQGWSGNFAHRLSPEYSLGILVSQINATGALTNQATTSRNVTLNLTGKVGRKSTATIGLRKADSENGVTTYSESAVTASLNLQL